MNFEAWIAVGIKNNWCGPAICYTHDGLPMSTDVEEEMYNGDPCLHVVRLYEDIEHKNSIESNHSPSQWRK